MSTGRVELLVYTCYRVINTEYLSLEYVPRKLFKLWARIVGCPQQSLTISVVNQCCLSKYSTASHHGLAVAMDSAKS